MAIYSPFTVAPVEVHRPVSPSYPQVGVELVQHQTHGARQVAHVRALLVQGVLEDFKVLHPLHGEAVVDDVRLQRPGAPVNTRNHQSSSGSRQEVTSPCS